MKKTKTAILLLILALLLSACGSPSQREAQKPENTGTLAASDSIGGAYVLEDCAAPQETMLAFQWQEEQFYVIPDELFGFQLLRGDNTVYSSDGILISIALAEKGLWLLEYRDDYILQFVSADGEGLKAITLSAVHQGEQYRSLEWCGGRLYLTCGGGIEVLVLSEDGELLFSAEAPGENTYFAIGSDGQIYAVSDEGNGSRLYRVHESEAAFEPAFSCGAGQIYSGRGGDELFLLSDTGLYALNQDGAERAVAVWAECGIAMNGLFSLQALEDGSFLCMDEGGAKLLKPVDPAEMKAKTELRIAMIGSNTSLSKAVSAFNSSNDAYYVRLIDYSDGGSFSKDEALTRLNTEILAGSGPDILCFSQISPYPFISRGLLTNLEEYLEKDSEISADDIAIAKALKSSGGIYFISGQFSFETLIARYDDFGDRCGWTLDEYLDIDGLLAPDEMLINNMTRETFISSIVSRYIRTAIDWNSAACSFDSPEFVRLLETGMSIRETPENGSSMRYGFGAAAVGAGERTTALSLVDSVWKLAWEEQTAGCRLSSIGWPTMDGSCGSDVNLNAPLGILAQGENGQGCWAFIKYMLQNADSQKQLPVYMPLLQEELARVKEDGELEVQMTDEDAERFLTLVSELENVALYDETALDIIRNEIQAFFNGDKTAEETAGLIQSRVGLYVAEQS